MSSGSEQRQRQRRLVIRFSDPEWDDLTARVENTGLPMSTYIRTVIFQTKPPRAARRPVKDASLLARALAELNKVGSNVNQLARTGNMGNWPEARVHEAVAQEICAVLDRIMEALGVRMKDNPPGG